MYRILITYNPRRCYINEGFAHSPGRGEKDRSRRLVDVLRMLHQSQEVKSFLHS